MPKPIPSRLRNILSIAAALIAASCGRSSETARVGTTVPFDASTDAPVAEVEAAAAPPPPDLDVHALERQLHCPNGRHAHACRILREFGRATHGMAQAPSGYGRFMGNAFRVEKGVEKHEFVVLAASNVNASTVGPTDIPLRVAMGSLPKDKRRDGGKLARALAQGSMPGSSNKALQFAKAWTSDNGRIAMTTDGPSIRLIAEEATYVRQTGQRALVIQMKPALPGVVAPPGDGTYAELWAVTW